MGHYCTFWSYDFPPPPFDELHSRVNTLIAGGAHAIYFIELERGTSDYCLVISDRPMTDEEAGTSWGNWFDRLPDDDAYTWYEDDEPELD